MYLDFPIEEYQARLARTHQLMHDVDVDALFITTEAEFRYFTGFRSLFWQSPTRGWYLVIPLGEKPIAIIPSIGAENVKSTFISDMYVFNCPAQYAEEIAILTSLFSQFERIATPKGAESVLRMPLSIFESLEQNFLDATPLIQELRMIKSTAEINHINTMCTIASKAFISARDWLEVGMSLQDIFRRFKISLLNGGAEEVPYLVGGAGQDGYSDVISPPSNYQVQKGDVLMLDTGATKHGYFCDFDRNFAIGAVSEKAKKAHGILQEATLKGIEVARPGVRCCDVYHEMAKVIGAESDIGRLGHGLGMQLTEWPSIAASDTTLLKENMVMTIEPAITTGDGKMLVHEENIVIGRQKNHILSSNGENWSL